jgi:ABC-type dipeptide/oligopeptide/nickel transport system permease subunit
MSRKSYFRRSVHQFRRHRPAMAGVIILFLFLVASIFAPILAPYDPLKQMVEDRLQGPTLKHWLGTDEFGRDILSRILYGGRLSMTVGFISVALGLLVGGAFGLISGYFRKLDNLIMRLMDILLSFPSILLAIGVMTILGPGLFNVMIAVGIRSIPSYSRMMRSIVLGIKEMQYTEASVALGAPSWRIILSTILPNSFPSILVYSTLEIANAILLGAILSYLGLGVQPPTPEWGIMVSGGRGWLRDAPHISIFPGLAIFLVSMSFNMVGDGLRDSLDVRLKENKG